MTARIVTIKEIATSGVSFFWRYIDQIKPDVLAISCQYRNRVISLYKIAKVPIITPDQPVNLIKFSILKLITPQHYNTY
jgi:hypothetical protein